MYNYLSKRPAKVIQSPKGKHYIKTGKRIYLATLQSYSSLEDGTTYIFNEDQTQVKLFKNLI